MSYSLPDPPPPPPFSSDAAPPFSILQPPSSSIVANAPPPYASSQPQSPPPMLSPSPPPPSLPPPRLSPPLPPPAVPPAPALYPVPTPVQSPIPSLPPLLSPPPPPLIIHQPPPPPPPPPSPKPPPLIFHQPPPPPPTLPLVPPPSTSPPPPKAQYSLPPILPPKRPTPNPHSRSNHSATRPPNPFPVPSSNSGSGDSTLTSAIKAGTVATLAIVAGLVMLSFLGAAVWFVKKRREPVVGYRNGFVGPSTAGSSHMSDTSSYTRSPALVRHSNGGFMCSPSEAGFGQTTQWFTYDELASITDGFSSHNLLGQGGFGYVYKGCLLDGRAVAVKQLKVGSPQGEREFRAEVEIISRVHHRHLVSLVGFCFIENQRLLVYDYVPNNTLHYHLHGSGGRILDWAIRVKIAAGAARGIAYLHEDCHPRIIHRDIKSSNILLDYNYEAQVSDFGLARLAMDACTHVTTRVMGTFGYLAPEYASSGKLTAKSDVYSFGVVLLELITGRKPVDTSQPLGDESLVEWARPLLSHALESHDFGCLPDPRLEKNYDESEMFRMIEAAATCTRHSAKMRPRMGQVVRALDSLSDLDLINGVRPGQSVLINSTQFSSEMRNFHRRAYDSQDYSRDASPSSWSGRDL